MIILILYEYFYLKYSHYRIDLNIKIIFISLNLYVIKKNQKQSKEISNYN